MSKPKQTTLFQSWGSKSQNQQGEKSDNDHGKQEKHPKKPRDWEQPEDTINLLDSDDDQELVHALEASFAEYTGLQSGMQSHQDAEHDDGVGNISFGIEDQDAEHGVDRSHCLSQWKASDVPVGDLQGYDQSAGKLWIYPTNYSVREYQFTIVRQALVKNTLVTLPTGLGKTFIASVVMYNYYRWYPEGKVVFMAPTKPLVAQQIEACYNIMGIPRQDTAEMTGSMNPTDRQKAWQDRRVFFLTPQVMTNDLSRGSCIAEAIKCLVVDEAHKALGNHAYCQVVRELVKYTRQFRILALSATPGSDIKGIQKVVSNLLISHIELRLEESPDIKPYTHHRTVDKIVVPLGEELSHIKLKFTQVLEVVVRRLTQQGVLYNRGATSLSKFLILKARDAFRQNPPESMPRSQYGSVEGDFAMAMSLYHGFELLQLHGLRSLYNFLEGIVNGTKAYGRTRSELTRNADFNDIMELLSKKFQTSGQSEDKTSFVVGHPKLVKLEEVVLEHFHKFQEADQATRVMIFSQYRDSVQEITSLLQHHQPLVKVMSFIGQSSVGKATKGFTQKVQLQVMQTFRTGGYNTLVSTCVGEEGLDIGEVDLIVCYDAHKSPIRLVQRMGRTGRKRQGRIVMLMTEGKEEQIYNHSQYTKRSIHRAILNGAKTLVFYASNPRMIPADMTPACHRMHITVQPPKPAPDQGAKGSRPKGRKPDKRKGDSKGGICVEQFAELRSKGCAMTVPSLPSPTMLFLTSSEQGDGSEGMGCVLSLAEWLPWQNSLQETSMLVAHSRRSQHLVELLEFTELQQALPPEEDNYGQEMSMYLDMDDVIDPRRPVSNDITQFIMPATRHQARSREQEVEDPETQAKKIDLAKKSEGTTRKKQKRVIQNLELPENSDDSDFLPEVDLFNAAGQWERGDTTRPDRDVEEDQPPQREEDVDRRMEAEALGSMSPDDDQDSASDSEVAACIEVSSRVPGIPRRLPSPPPVEDIDRLLSFIRAEDWASVDIENITGGSSRFADPIPSWWTGRLEMPRPVIDKHPLFMGVFPSLREARKVEVREVVDEEKAVEIMDYITAEVSDEVVQVKEVPISIEKNKEVADAIGSAQINTNKIVTQFEHSASSDSKDSAEKNMGGFEGQTSGAKNEEQTIAAVTKEGGDSSQQTCLADSSPGKQDKQPHTEGKTTPAARHKSFYDTAASDSFFHKNFFEDDEDFELTETHMTKTLNIAKDGDASLRAGQTDFSRVRALDTDTSVVAVTSSLPIPSAASPVSEAVDVSTNSSMLTFTQALSFVHNHSASDFYHSEPFKPNAESAQNVGHENAHKASAVMTAPTLTSSDKEDDVPVKREDDPPNFDLGFDFDEDIIPPSPEADAASVSQLTGKSVSSVSRLALVTANKRNQDPAENTDDFEDDAVLLDAFEEDIEQDSPCFSLSVPPKQLEKIETRKGLSAETSAANIASKSSAVSDDFPEVEISRVSKDFPEVHLPQIGKRKLALSSTNRAAPRKAGVGSKEAASETEADSSSGLEADCWDESESSDVAAADKTAQVKGCKSLSLRDEDPSPGSSTKHVPRAQPQLNLSSIRTSTSKEVSFAGFHDVAPEFGLLSDGLLSDDDDFDLDPKMPFTKVSPLEQSPVSKEKKGAAVLCSTPMRSQQVKSLGTSQLNLQGTASAFPLELEDDDFEESVLAPKKSKRARLLSPDSTMDKSDNDDFEESVIVPSKSKRARLQSPDSTGNEDNDVSNEHKLPSKKKQKHKVKKHGCAFLDDEAELSDDVAVSSDEDEENAELLEGSFINNCTQMTQASQIDMQTVYMKSVRNPDDGLRGHQRAGRYRLQFNPATPAINVYSQLPNCLEEESQYQEDSFCVGSEEESAYDNSEEEEEEEDSLLEGLAAVSNRNKRQAVQQVEGRKRVRRLVASSSDEDETFHRLPASQAVVSRAKSVKALLSSSDEQLEISAAEISASPLKGSTNDPDGDGGLKCLSKPVPQMGKRVSSQGFSVSRPDRTEGPEGVGSFPKPSKTGDSDVSYTVKSKPWQKKSLPKSSVHGSSKTITTGDKAAAHSSEQSRPSRLDSEQTLSAKNPSSNLVSTKPNMPSPVSSSSVSRSNISKYQKSSKSDCVPAETLAQSAKKGAHGGIGDGGDGERQKAATSLSQSEDCSNTSARFTSIVPRERGKMVILVDSREISGAQDIVSDLRLKHKSYVCTRQLAACDYILSNRLAVDRITLSNFSNGSNRSRLLERLQQMQSLYDRCIIIVENDRVKPGEEKQKKFLDHTKYVDTLLAQLCQTIIRLFFTNNQNETASLLAQLTTVECQKEMTITAPVDLSPAQEQVVRFYLSLPRLCITHALNLRSNFTTIRDFMQSSVNGVQTKGHMSFSRATEVVNYIRRRFCQALSRPVSSK